MKIIINVAPKYAASVREFKAQLEKPVPPHKGTPSISLVVHDFNKHMLNVRHEDIKFDDVPGEFAVGDIIADRTKMGWWGRITGGVPAANPTKYVVSPSLQTAELLLKSGATQKRGSKTVPATHFFVKIEDAQALF